MDITLNASADCHHRAQRNMILEMPNEIAKPGLSPMQTLRYVLLMEDEDVLAIARTAVKDGSKGLMARGISVLQRWNEKRFGEAFLDELEEMKRAGEIREDFNQTDAGVSSLREFFELIDGKPDEKRFRAFCALFMSANAPNADSNEAILDLELMGILRELTGGEMHLLSAFLKVKLYTVGPDDVMELLAGELGYRADALVEKNAQALFRTHLINERNFKDRSGTHGQQKDLLTDLGLALRERIERYNKFKEDHISGSDEGKKSV